MKKIYQIKNAHSVKKAINFSVNGKSKTVVFESKNKNGILLFETTDTDIMSAIEKSKYFNKKGSTLLIQPITLLKKEKTAEDDNHSDSQNLQNGDSNPALSPNPQGDNLQGGGTKVFAEVVTFKEAKAVLTGEPYNIPFQALGSVEKVFAKAAEVGVSFPNLKID
ncbi:MAG: hypothetical protein FWF72_06780 [Paludibacter sp.]|nr:hypothetical protein [Paludibacter sp.]